MEEYGYKVVPNKIVQDIIEINDRNAKIKKLISLNPELELEIRRFGAKNSLKTRSKAVSALCRIGLEVLK